MKHKKMRVIRVKSTGRVYALSGRYSELPCLRINEEGEPEQTGFSYSELAYMLEHGNAEVIGEAELSLKVSINE